MLAEGSLGVCLVMGGSPGDLLLFFCGALGGSLGVLIVVLISLVLGVHCAGALVVVKKGLLFPFLCLSCKAIMYGIVPGPC